MASLLVGKVVYGKLVHYIVILCAFIPAWVFLVLGWQLLGSYKLSSASKENNWIEWV